MRRINIGDFEVSIASKLELEGMAADQPLFVVCKRAKAGFSPVMGSEVVKCSSCGADVWISPATKRCRPENSLILCIRCAIDKIKERIGEYEN